MGKWIHRMVSRDLTTETGVCAACGPVGLTDKGTCAAALRPKTFGCKGCNDRFFYLIEGIPTVCEYCSDLTKNRKLYREVSEYVRIWHEQSGKCAICGNPEHRTFKGEISLLSWDHCHQTGQMRGLLCMSCNLALGLLKDDAIRLMSALSYLERKYDPKWVNVRRVADRARRKAK